MFDCLIQNVKLFDGSGRPAFVTDVGIKEGKIQFIGNHSQKGDAKTTVDANGACMCPGFVDAHSHGDLFLGTERGAVSKLSQGVTTEIAGQCGLSMFPINPSRVEESKKMLSLGAVRYPEEFGTLKDFVTYKKFVEKQNMALNMAIFMGHGSLRMAVMGEENRRPQKAEIDEMKRLLKGAMENGALGLSSGLIYSPGVFAESEELTELCKVVAEYDGIYTTHMRNESARVLQALEEAIHIAKQTGVRLNLSHIKVMGKDNWGLSARMLHRIQQARESGLRITMDQYPYEATCTSLNICIPPWYFNSGIKKLIQDLGDKEIREKIKEEMKNPVPQYDNNYVNCGGFHAIQVVSCKNCQEAKGLTVEEYAKRSNKDAFDAYFDLLIENEGEGLAVYFCLGREDIFRLIQDPFCMVGSDGTCFPEGEAGHPRSFGTFPQAIRWFTWDKQLFSMEEMIRKMTGLPAEAYGLKGKGRIAPGMDADFVLFDEQSLCPGADYQVPDGLTRGIHSVWVGGEKAYENGKLTGTYKGKFLA
ncbi:MAG: D-aminoacylase [Lachnospiraceae bacterium]|nr:D-aminoacylase [Lachnospiraceae bacterium]